MTKYLSKADKKKEFLKGKYAVFGIIIGLILGIPLGNVGLGFGIGIILGFILEYSFGKARHPGCAQHIVGNLNQ
jgi:cytochrome c biogenesis protein CcdA